MCWQNGRASYMNVSRIAMLPLPYTHGFVV
jgi:hypothetical protein